jgi:hypothetical protein
MVCLTPTEACGGVRPGDLLGLSLFCVCWFDFRLDSSDLCLPSLFMVAALVRRSFGALEQ